METIKLLAALDKFVSLLQAIAQNLNLDAGKMEGSVSLSYDTIDVSIDKYVHCAFRIKGNGISIDGVYVKQGDEKALKRFIASQIPEGGYLWDTASDHSSYSPEVVRYVAIADEIAKTVYQYDIGDNYRPGYYSEIIASLNEIILRQVNRHNAKSKDHKSDYFMRDLEFFIPLLPSSVKPSFEEELIGKMRIRFIDHSSKQNKMGGDLIRKKINSERAKF